ncbi:MAG: hypothetical protein GY827_00905 [Cytophagales bacterium]|nr:hypothetical protein [Cytophagales bacterium]
MKIFGILYLLVYFTQTGAAASKSIYAFAEGKEVISVVYFEKINREEMNFQNEDYSTPINALKSFFYLGLKEDLRGIIDMHYEKDGSRNYVSKLLNRNPKAFSGASNLKSLSIKGIYYWGKHRIVEFDMKNKSGSSIGWSEDFICSQSICKKSNYLNIFGDSSSRSLFWRLYRSPKLSVGSFDLGNYMGIELNPVFASEKSFPIRLYYKVSKLSDANKKSKWYRLLTKIEDNSIDLSLEKIQEKKDFLDTYIPSIFSNWDKEKMADFRFDGVEREKKMIIQNLSTVSAINIDSYLESKNMVWVFVSALNYKKNDSNFIFLYNKNTSLFELSIPKKGNVRFTDGFIRNKIFEKKLFTKEIDQ